MLYSGKYQNKTSVKPTKKVKSNVKKSVKPKMFKTAKKSVSKSGCVEQTTKKYQERRSPAYPANKCCGQIKKGKDGLMYKSRSDKNGVCTWKKHSGIKLRRRVPLSEEQLTSLYKNRYRHDISRLEEYLEQHDNKHLRGRLDYLRKELIRLLDKEVDDMPLQPLRLVRH